MTTPRKSGMDRWLKHLHSLNPTLCKDYRRIVRCPAKQECTLHVLSYYRRIILYKLSRMVLLRPDYCSQAFICRISLDLLRQSDNGPRISKRTKTGQTSREINADSQQFCSFKSPVGYHDGAPAETCPSYALNVTEHPSL